MKMKSWSFSRLLDYQMCPLRARLKHVDRVPDPRPSEAADRGTRIHELAEHWLLGKIKELPPELSKFHDFFPLIKGHKLDLEQEWGVDRDWKPTEYKTAWGRIKADAVVHLSPKEAIVIDFKTGRSFGNQVKHGEQLQLYALATFIMYPDVEMVHAEIWYLDENETLNFEVPRHVAIKRYLPNFDKRARKMTETEEFPATPNVIACKYCPYGDTGHCDKRVVDAQATSNFYKRRAIAKKGG